MYKENCATQDLSAYNEPLWQSTERCFSVDWTSKFGKSTISMGTSQHVHNNNKRTRKVTLLIWWLPGSCVYRKWYGKWKQNCSVTRHTPISRIYIIWKMLWKWFLLKSATSFFLNRKQKLCAKLSSSSIMANIISPHNTVAMNTDRHVLVVDFHRKYIYQIWHL